MERQNLAPWHWFKNISQPIGREESFSGDSVGFSRDLSNFETLFPKFFR